MKKIFTSFIIAIVLFGSFAPAIARAEVQSQDIQAQIIMKQKILSILQQLVVLYQLLAEAQAREALQAQSITPSVGEFGQLSTPTVEINNQSTSTIEMATVKTFTVTPPADNTYFKVQSGLSFEQLRDFAVSTNANMVKFREKMSQASEAEVVEYLQNNGFTVVKK